MDNHAIRNVFKWKQDFIDGRLGIAVVAYSFLSSIDAYCPSLALR